MHGLQRRPDGTEASIEVKAHQAGSGQYRGCHRQEAVTGRELVAESAVCLCLQSGVCVQNLHSGHVLGKSSLVGHSWAYVQFDWATTGINFC